MVKSDTRLIIAIAVVLVIVGVFAYVSLSCDNAVEYPESRLVDDKALCDFRVVIWYHFDRVDEGAEFRVDVFDKDTEKVVEGANVSFMIPEINHVIPEEGYVYFYAPGIEDEYLLHPDDTSRAFPITVKKEGYNTYITSVTVHLTS